MKVASWNVVSWGIASWDSVVSQLSLLPLPPPPLRLRESTRRVGVHNVTVMKESLIVNKEARVFFEFNGITGLDTINLKDFDC